MSVAVVQRTIIRKLRARDAETLAQIELAAGAVITNWRIRRYSQAEVGAGAEPYSVPFECAGRQCECPLPVFQARTQPSATGDAAGAIAV